MRDRTRIFFSRRSDAGISRRRAGTLCLPHPAEEGLVDGEARDRVEASDIGEFVHVALLPRLSSERPAASHCGIDCTAHDIVGQPGGEENSPPRRLYPHPLAFLDPQCFGILT